MTTYFTQGTLTASGTYARDIRQAWVSAFTGQAGWTIVDNGYVAGTIERSVIINSLGFAIMISNSTVMTDTWVWLHIGRTYNTGTHVLNSVSTNNNRQAGTVDSDCFTSLTLNPSSVGTVASSTAVSGAYEPLITATPSQSAWSAHIGPEQATLSVKTGGVNQGQWVHFGKATTLIDNPSVTDDYPFFLTFSLSSLPIVPANPTYMLTYAGNPNATRLAMDGSRYIYSHATSIKTLPPANAISYADKYSLTPTVGTLSEMYIVRAPATDANNYLGGFLRAKMVDILNANALNAIYGDRVIIGPKTYMYIGGTYSGSGRSYAYAGWAAIN